MLSSCYLRDGTAYIPTVARRASGPIYTDIEPIVVLPLSDISALCRALLEAVARKNIIIPDPDPKALRAPPVILKYARVRSWSAFFRNAWTWSIRNDDGVYKIIGYRKQPKGYWEQDPNQEIKFPVGTRLDEVVDRMIAILQEAARQGAEL
jgi:hypothetical protein